MTEYLAYSIQYRRLLMRFPLGPGRTATGCSTPWRCSWSTSTAPACSGATARSPTRCSAATATRSRPSSSTPRPARSTRACRTASALRPRDPRRERRLRAGRPRGDAGSRGCLRRCRRGRRDRPIPVRVASGPSSTSSRSSPPDDRHAVRARIRRLNDLGFAVDEIELEPAGPRGFRAAPRRGHQPAVPRARAGAADRASSRSRARPGCCSTTCASTAPGSSTMGSGSSARTRPPTLWLRDVSSRASRSLVPAIGAGPRSRPGLLRRPRAEVAPVRGGRRATSGSRRPSRPTSSSARPAPEDDRGPAGTSIALDIDWSTPSTGRIRESSPSLSVGASVRARGADVWHHSADADDRHRRRAGHPRRGLVKRYGDLVAVDGIDFEVASGEVFGLLGPERRRQDHHGRDPRGPAQAGRGRATVLGLDVAKDANALKPRIGVSLQTAALYPKLDGRSSSSTCSAASTPTSRPTAELIDALELGERANARTRSCPAASGSASRSPWPSSTTRSWSSSTSRRPAWTRPPGGRCGTSSSASSARAGRSC